MDCLILEYLPNVHILTQICNLCFFPLIFVDFQQKCDHSENTDSKETSKNLFQGFSFERLACILAYWQRSWGFQKWFLASCFPRLTYSVQVLTFSRGTLSKAAVQ